MLYCFIADKETFIFLQDEFLINTIGLVFGLTVTIVTFIYSALDRIERFIIKPYKDIAKKEFLVNRIKALFSELISNTKLIFYGFIFVLLMILWENIDIPFIGFVYKIDVIYIIKFFIVVSVIVATIDVFNTLFGLLSLIKYEKQDL